METQDPIDEILAACGLMGSWESLTATGLANRIYATDDVVIRIAREYDEALRDARTESVAAPIAYEAGLKTPCMLVYDDSRELVAGPYSVWERVHGETLGLLDNPLEMPSTWREVGRQVGLLHTAVKPFADPDKKLHTPTREPDLLGLLDRLDASYDVMKQEIVALIKELETAALGEFTPAFLHSDVKAMNIMCTQEDEFLALIDWGDSGWGDPTFDFRQVPLQVIDIVLEGYREIALDNLDDTLTERIVWDKIYEGIWAALRNPEVRIPVGDYQKFLEG